MTTPSSPESRHQPNTTLTRANGAPVRSTMWIVVFGLIAAVVTLAASVTTVYLMRENALRKEMQELNIVSLLFVVA